MKTRSIVIGTLAVATALAGLASPAAATDPDCSLRDVDWGQWADDSTSNQEKARQMAQAVDPHRLRCTPADYKRIVDAIEAGYLDTCAIVDVEGVETGSSNSVSDYREKNWQVEAASYSGEAHVYYADPGCGREEVWLFAGCQPSGGSPCGGGYDPWVVMYAEDTTVDRSFAAASPWVGTGSPSGNLFATAALSVPACDPFAIVSDPVDPTWAPTSMTMFGPGYFGSPWATSPYGPAPFTPFLNQKGNCEAHDHNAHLDVGGVVATLVPVVAPTTFPVKAFLDDCKFVAPGGGPQRSILLIRFAVGATPLNACAAIGGTNTERLWLVDAFAASVVPVASEIAICDGIVEFTAFNEGIDTGEISILVPCHT